MKTASRLFLATFLLAAVSVVLLFRQTHRSTPSGALASSRSTGTDATASLLVFCAAGLKAPVTEAVTAYQNRFGARVELQFGGSGTLLANLRVAGRGDVFIAADTDYLELGRSNRLVDEILPLAAMKPVLAVRRSNPKSIRSLADLEREGVAVALANPDAAAIGRLTRTSLARAGLWDAFATRAKVFKPTVNDIANDIKLGTVDAGVVWDATVRQYPELQGIEATEFAGLESRVALGILRAGTQPRAALHFARFLAAPDAGLVAFAKAGYRVVEGDAWTDRPEAVLYSGGVNRVAIEETVRRFEEREGAKVTRVYNGCGILTAQIRAGQRPDAYFACDVSFMTNVQDHFMPAVELASTRMVILTRRGNPSEIRSLADLGKNSLRVGVANEEQSALGALTARLLRRLRLHDSVARNIAVQTPTADLLVNQLRAGGLDAAIVYEANTSQVREVLDVIPIDIPGALAIQPYAVGRASPHRYLMERLMAALESEESRRRFEEAGFGWGFPVNTSAR